MPHVTRIVIYPIKALDGISVPSARISAAGTLEQDRNFALLDREGHYVNGKRNPAVHRLRCEFDLENRIVCLFREGSETRHRFQVDHERGLMEDWLGDFFGFPIQFQHQSPLGFPDDLDAFGPTIIGEATLTEIAAWYPELGQAELSLRFRANIEIDSEPAFWEDRLFDEPGTVVDFAIGSVRFEGSNPCQRCVVPSRDPRSGEAYPSFQRIFAAKRKETLPSWATASRFNHYYRVSVNTRIPASQSGKEIRLGDELRIVGKRSL
ncbi:MAG: MOSC domain-containing protein [Methylococcales bacterium]